MAYRITKASRQLATDNRGGVAVIVALSLPVILGFSALALEYGSALITRSENQRTSDIAAFGAAHAYTREASASEADKEAAADAAAKSISALNGVPSDRVSVRFPDTGTIDVEISEDKPIYLSRLLRQDDSVTISTASRVALGQVEGLTPCILGLGDDMKKDGVTFNGAAGDYELTRCGVGSNSEIAANGFTLDTKCAAPSFKKPGTCDEETEQGEFVDRLAGLTDWPESYAKFDDVCKKENTGEFPEAFTINDDDDENGENNDHSKGKGKEKGKGKGKDEDNVTLREGVLCITSFGDIKNVSSDPDGNGNTLIVKEGNNEGNDLKLSGNKSLTIIPSKEGDFAGVSFYAPVSEVTVSGNSAFEINGISCYGMVAKNITFNGNVSLSAECDQENNKFSSSGGKPHLIR